MTKVMFGPYEPDVATVGLTSSAVISGVLPAKSGYVPFPSLVGYGDALPAPCRGGFEAVLADGTSAIFAGTSTNLYRFNTTTLGWDVVSKAGAYVLLDTENWSFVQFGPTVIAVTNNVAPQSFNLITSTLFANLGGNPPAARGVVIVGEFVVLYSLTAAPQRIQWSGLNNATFWTPGQQNSDYQDFPDGGAVRGVAGGEFGLVFQDTAIRRMVFSAGSQEIFDFSRISQDRGVVSPYALAQAGQSIFLLGQDGFYRTDESGALTPIGSARVNETFFADADLTVARNIAAVADPNSQRVFWSYKSVDGPLRGLDKMIIYDWSLDRWSSALFAVDFLGAMAKPGYTLETLDTVSSSVDGLPRSLDSYTGASLLNIAAIDATGTLGFFTGAPIEAVLETPEGNLGAAARTFVRGAAPIGDAGAALLSLWRRDRLIDVRVQTRESAIGVTGYAPQRSNARFHTGRLRIPAGSAWTFVRGVDVDGVPGGQR